MDDVEHALRECELWVATAAQALLTFWDGDAGLFIRETTASEQGGRLIAGRTSTNRALCALVEYSYVAEELPLGGTSGTGMSARETSALVSSRISACYRDYLARLSREPTSFRASTVNGLNMFTDSYLVLAALGAEAHQRRAAGRDGGGELHGWATLEHVLEAILDDNIGNFRSWQGGKLDSREVVHDVVSLAFVRAVDFFNEFDSRDFQFPRGLSERVERDVAIQFGWHAAGAAHRFDPAELTFGYALLERFNPGAAASFAPHLVDVLSDAQSPDGAFPTSRVVSRGNHSLLHVASTEVALTLVTVALSHLRIRDTALVERLLPLLERCMTLIRRSYSVVSGFQGWANDRARRSGTLESWATAITLSYLVRYRAVLHEYQQQRILGRYRVGGHPGREAGPAWPDYVTLIPLRDPSDSTPELDVDLDPDTRQDVTENIVAPVERSAQERPAETVRFLVNRPGTSIHRLAAGLAETLGWPLVTVIPSDLRTDGSYLLEMGAARALEDFTRLRRVVVHMVGAVARLDDRASRALGPGSVWPLDSTGVCYWLDALRETRRIVLLVELDGRLDLTAVEPASLPPPGVPPPGPANASTPGGGPA